MATELTKNSGKQIHIELAESISKDIQEALSKISPILASNVRSTFDKKGARGDNPPWQITSNPTPLVKTGRLRDSIKGLVQKDGEDYILVVGTDLDYAKKHNEGLGHLPKREFMFLADEDFEVISKYLNSITGAKEK